MASKLIQIYKVELERMIAKLCNKKERNIRSLRRNIYIHIQNNSVSKSQLRTMTCQTNGDSWPLVIQQV